jgi:hypothetical protein
MSCELLQKALEAHGGLDRWRCFAAIQATIVTGGQLFGMKGKRRAYMGDERRSPIHDRLMVSIDLSEISLS